MIIESVGDFLKTLSILCLAGIVGSANAQQTSIENALRSAQSNRPALQSARLRLDQANQSSRSLGAYPATRLSLGYTTDPETGGSDDDLVLSQPLDFFGRTNAFRKSGKALISEARAQYRQAALDVQNEVVEAYIGAVSSNELARSAQAVQAVYARLHEATRLRVEGGKAPGFHLTQVTLDLEQAKLRFEQRQSEAVAALQRLQAVAGLTSPPEVMTGFPELNVQEANSATLRTQRPDLLNLDAQIQLAEADVAIARASGRPELEIQGRRTPWQERDDSFGIRLQLNIPLFDHGRASGETRAATHKARAAEKAFQDALRLAEGEVKSARTEFASARDQVGRYQSLVRQALDLVDRLRPGLTEQATTLIEVLDATRMLRDLEQAHVEARARLALAQARLIRATGQIIEVTP